MRKLAILCCLVVAGMIAGWKGASIVWMGRQPNGHYIVSSGQEILPGTISFSGRPSDFALKPDQDVLAVQTDHNVFLVTRKGVQARTLCQLPQDVGAGFRGLVWIDDKSGANWTPTGRRFVVSTDQGYLQEYLYEDWQITPQEKIWLVPQDHPRQVWPGGMTVSKDGKMLYVAVADLNAVCQIDLATRKVVKQYPVQRLPFECRLSEDGKDLLVSNWGGRTPREGDRLGKTGEQQIVIDAHGAAATGCVSIVHLETGDAKTIEVGIHPTSIVIDRNHAYVANASSDSISDIDLVSEQVTRTIPVGYNGRKEIGAMPNALAIQGNTLFCCNGGDNALAEIDLPSGKVKGLRPAGYWPIALQLSHDGQTMYVLNSKGNGSVANTDVGNAGNPHDFEGTISVIDLKKELGAQSKLVAHLNHWDRDFKSEAKGLAVYNGAVKHVLYIIKENQTYDSIYGDMPEGNGDPSLCILGEKVMPNHRKIARDFTLFDNGYVSGTNSADGHAWSTQAVANDYMEHEYVGYRTYPDDGKCSMSIAPQGCIWDAALKKGKKIRVYGEYCDADLATFEPRAPKNWFEAWDDRQSGRNVFKYHCETRIPSLKPYICRDLHYWPIIESDQHRADVFLREYAEFSKRDQVPDLMILTLTNDHGSGLDPDFPTIAAMGADNDLAFGRVVEAISKSPQWKDTAIFMIEDDGQALPDHVDGHRTAYQVISPYSRRHTVDHTLYTTVDMLKSIEMMLGIDPMNRFDALARPITTCFQNTPDLTPYEHTPNKTPLDERQPKFSSLSAEGKRLFLASKRLDWSHLDGPDPAVLSRVYWYSLTKGRPYPEIYAMRPETNE
jgi:YVTN family beta-propeller protein